jgi:hypothetical protein
VALLGAALSVGAVLWVTWPAPGSGRGEDASLARHETRPPDASARERDATRRRDASGPKPDTEPRRDLAAPEVDAAPGSVSDRPPRRVPGGDGELDLNSSPWARVTIDGRLAGETPLQGLKLRAGKHVVRLVNQERRLSAQLTIQIHAGRTTRRWIRLVAPLSP